MTVGTNSSVTHDAYIAIKNAFRIIGTIRRACERPVSGALLRPNARKEER